MDIHKIDRLISKWEQEYAMLAIATETMKPVLSEVSYAKGVSSLATLSDCIEKLKEAINE